MTLGKVVNPKESVETRCHGLTDLCLWDYDVKHYLVIVVWGFFGNLTEGEKKKKVPGVACGNLSVPPGALKKKKRKKKMSVVKTLET